MSSLKFGYWPQKHYSYFKVQSLQKQRHQDERVVSLRVESLFHLLMRLSEVWEEAIYGPLQIHEQMSM